MKVKLSEIKNSNGRVAHNVVRCQWIRVETFMLNSKIQSVYFIILYKVGLVAPFTTQELLDWFWWYMFCWTCLCPEKQTNY